MCQSLIGKTCKIYKKNKTSIYDIPYFVNSNAIMSKVYEWFPKRRVEKILEDVYEWQLNNIKILKNIFK